MHLAVHGAGATGCFIGGCFADRGAQVTLIGRPALLTSLDHHAMTLTDYTGWKTEIAPTSISLSTEARTLAQADMVLLCIKNTSLESAIGDLATYVKPGTPILSLQNGIGHIDRLKQALPSHQILRGSIPYNVARVSDTHWHKGTMGKLLAEISPATRQLAAFPSPHPGALQVKDNMLEITWGKLLLNLNNALNALSGLTLKQELSDQNFRKVLAASIQEALDLLRHAQITPAKVGAMPPKLLPGFLRLPDWFIRHIGLRLQKIDATARSSMADDFTAGRATEIDFLNGEVVALANRLGKTAPINAKIVELVKQAETGGQKQWTGAALCEAVLKQP